MTPEPTQRRAPWYGLVTDSGKPDNHFIREGAILELAQDCVLGHDAVLADNALIWSRHFMDVYEASQHDGDCTNQAHTCARCMCDEAMEESRRAHGE